MHSQQTAMEDMRQVVALLQRLRVRLQTASVQSAAVLL
jgi:hypothetical protein